jgi:hypothetical protein
LIDTVHKLAKFKGKQVANFSAVKYLLQRTRPEEYDDKVHLTGGIFVEPKVTVIKNSTGKILDKTNWSDDEDPA